MCVTLNSQLSVAVSGGKRATKEFEKFKVTTVVSPVLQCCYTFFFVCYMPCLFGFVRVPFV